MNFKVGITGHRKLGDDPRTAWYVHAECVRILDPLRDLASSKGGRLEAYSALAIGADQIFARSALGLGIPLVGVIPFEDYPDDFEGADRQEYEKLLALCNDVHRLPIRKRSNTAYLKAGQWIVQAVDVLVAVWDGQPARGKGGTAEVVDYAGKIGKLILRIDPAGAIS